MNACFRNVKRILIHFKTFNHSRHLETETYLWFLCSFEVQSCLEVNLRNIKLENLSRKLCGVKVCIKLIRLWSQTDPNSFLMAPGDFFVEMDGAPIDALDGLWNEEMTQAVDMIPPKHLLISVSAQVAFGLLRSCGQ